MQRTKNAFPSLINESERSKLDSNISSTLFDVEKDHQSQNSVASSRTSAQAPAISAHSSNFMKGLRLAGFAKSWSKVIQSLAVHKN